MRRLGAGEALKHAWFSEAPLAVKTEDMPTFPSMHEVSCPPFPGMHEVSCPPFPGMHEASIIATSGPRTSRRCYCRGLRPW